MGFVCFFFVGLFCFRGCFVLFLLSQLLVTYYMIIMGVRLPSDTEVKNTTKCYILIRLQIRGLYVPMQTLWSFQSLWWISLGKSQMSTQLLFHSSPLQQKGGENQMKQLIGGDEAREITHRLLSQENRLNLRKIHLISWQLSLLTEAPAAPVANTLYNPLHSDVGRQSLRWLTCTPQVRGTCVGDNVLISSIRIFFNSQAICFLQKY